MKYKSYSAIFIITLLVFMTVSGGILDGEDGQCPDEHITVSFDKFQFNSNGTEAKVIQEVNLGCEEGYMGEDDCGGDTGCESFILPATHYQVSVTVLQDGSTVQNVSSDVVKGSISNTFTSLSIGDYIIRYTIVCDEGRTSTSDHQITITEGINGNFDLTGLAITCDETGNKFEFTSKHFKGNNSLFVDNTAFDLQLNMTAEVDSLLYPCIENSFELNESGELSSDGQTVTISYVDGSATVSQTFSYTYDGQNLKMTYAEEGEDTIVMSFKNSTLLAKR